MWFMVFVPAFRMLQQHVQYGTALRVGCASAWSWRGVQHQEGLQLGNDAWARSSPLGFAHSLRPHTASSSSSLNMLKGSIGTFRSNPTLALSLFQGFLFINSFTLFAFSIWQVLSVFGFGALLLEFRPVGDGSWLNQGCRSWIGFLNLVTVASTPPQPWFCLFCGKSDGELVRLSSSVVFATFVLLREQELLWQGTIKESGLCAILQILEQKFGDGLHGQMDLGPRRIAKKKLKFDLMPNYLRFFREHTMKMVKVWSKQT